MFEFILIALVTAPALGLYFYFTRNFKFWQKLGIPYVKPLPFAGNLKECALQKVHIGEHLKKIYDNHSDKPYVGIFSFDQPSLSVRNLELVKDFQDFMDRQFSSDEKTDHLWSRSIFVLKGQSWRRVRTTLTPLLSSGKMKMMFCLVDICGKELAAYLDKVTAESKFFQEGNISLYVHLQKFGRKVYQIYY
jgi:hypothetical protein